MLRSLPSRSQPQTIATTVAPKNEAVLIVGGGTFGFSTALELSEPQFTDITVLDSGSELPSPLSAGCDLNKIVRVEYDDDFYTSLALDAVAEWKTPFFAPFYEQSGLINATLSGGDEKDHKTLRRHLDSVANRPGIPPGSISCFESGDDIRATAPQLTGSMEGWSGHMNRFGGFARAGKAMAAVHAQCRKNSVKFVLGADEGQAETLIFDGARCIGARTRCGRVHRARRTIVALGAHVARLVPSIAPQITAKAWSVAHLHLSPAQADSMMGTPVVNCRDLGFFFEPDPDTGLLKLCAHRAGLTNYGRGETSVPPSSSSGLAPAGRIPREDNDKLVSLIKAAMPQFSSIPLTRRFICWCGDTTDSNFIIDFVPGTEDQSLLVFSGDSGHAFKMFPIAGRWAREVLEQGEQKLDRWKWKGTPDGRPEDVSWRSGSLEELVDVKEWVGDEDDLADGLSRHVGKSGL
ncbi:FAD dependent oxidoreductase [Dactylonectria macrodidyma]|uniref:FAD dependent oxidoreductase n=1 Tax=Dactylonectria macrodidyma TaxID=307937 RepID=A0A9P9JJI4_9HYPO|nr:FAD dependent oxidoreductase [Dactylonectria macrodidyma]